MANELAAVLNTSVVATTLDEVGADYPDLDKAKYWYEVTSKEELLREYAEVLVKGTEAFPVVEGLASSSTLLTAEAVRGFPVDRDAIFEGLIAHLYKQTKEPELTRAEIDADAKAVAKKRAEVTTKAKVEKPTKEQLEEEQIEKTTGGVS